MTPQQIRTLFECHRDLGVPVKYTVSLVFKVQGLSLKAAAEQAGYEQSILHKSLAGQCKVPLRLKAIIEDKLGLDPWAV